LRRFQRLLFKHKVIGIQNFGSPFDQAHEQTEILLKKARNITFPAKITDQIVLGFDGYLDNLLSIVRVRHSPSNYEIMEKIAEWAERIAQSAGSSASMERIVKQISVGGFTCNVGKALSTLCGKARNVHLIGAFGLPTMHQIFQEQLEEFYQCTPFSVGNPGYTDAYEFSDGKIMVVSFENINRLDWNQIVVNTGQEFLIEEFDKSQLWGVGYWSSSPHMSEIFSALQTTIFPSLSHSAHSKYLILDLSDLRKKPLSQLAELNSLLPRFEEYVQVVLLLNDRELEGLGAALNGKAEQNPLALTRLIQKKLDLSFVISHGPKLATLVSKKIENLVLNAFTSSPRFTTSAGDHFTAGVAYALLAKAPIEVISLLGNCVSSFFVRKGASPTAPELQQFLAHYTKYLEKDRDIIVGH
jgi:hypothetical protein